MNQLASQLMGQQLLTNPLVQAYKAVQQASNTDAVLKQQLAKLPNGKEVLAILEQCGGDYEQATKQCVQKLGINISDLASIINNTSF